MSIADLLSPTTLTTAQIIDLCIGCFCIGAVAGIVFRSWEREKKD